MKTYQPHDLLQNAVVSLFHGNMISSKGIIELCTSFDNDKDLKQEIVNIHSANRHTARKSALSEVIKWVDLHTKETWSR